MNTLLAAAIRCSLILLVPTVAYAISAQWDLDPISGDWNTAANWTPNGVPNGPADIATFGVSNTTDVSISANTEVNSIIFTPAATNPYTITVSRDFALIISGLGIINNSGVMQNFVTMGKTFGVPSAILFTNSASAGSNVTFNNIAGPGPFGGFAETVFFDSASAGNATFINHGSGIYSATRTEFFGNSTAANGTFINNGGMVSNGSGGATTLAFSTTAANGTFINNGGSANGAFGGATVLSGTAANAVITNNAASASGAFGGLTSILGIAEDAVITNNGASVSGAGGGRTIFWGNATGGDAVITNNGASVAGAGSGYTRFTSGGLTASTAGSATLIANGGIGGGEGGAIFFEGRSVGGTAQVELFGNGELDISAHDPRAEMTIGSLEGDGNVFLGANNLAVGSNNLSTDFSGVIQDGGENGGTGGSLTKIGNGTLVLSGTNTYTGDTNVNGGVLKVDGSILSNTVVRHGGTLAGTGTINANVTNNRGTVSPGDAPGTLTINGSYTQAQFATLMIQIAGTNAGDFSVLNVLGNANLNGYLDPVLLNGFVPAIGDSFVFLTYGSLTDQFAHIRHQVFDNGLLQWSVTYEANHAILTVEQHVPDQDSTFLLLALGLLGLVTYQRQLLRKQS